MRFNNHRIVCSLLSIVGTASLVAFTVPAHAAPRDATFAPTTTVSYADLDLSKPRDRSRLEGRISRAADRVCTASNAMPMERITCKTNAVAQARQAAGLAERG